MSVLEAEEVLWVLGGAANGASAALLLVLAAIVVASTARDPLSRDRSRPALAAVLALTGLSHALHVGLFTLRVAHVPWMVATVGLDLVCALAVGACLLSHLHAFPRGLRDEGVLRCNDRVVQRLTEANLALELGQHDILHRCLGDGLREAKALGEDLMRVRGGAA